MARRKGVMKYRHDIFDRLEATTATHELCNAHAVIGRLQDDAYQYFKEGSDQFEKWNNECLDLDSRLRKFTLPLQYGGEEPVVLLEKFIVQFEHVERRFRQLLNEDPVPQPYHESKSFPTDFWLNALFRFAVNATLLEIERRGAMEKHVEERFERIEKGLEETKEILKSTVMVLNRTAEVVEETALLARENQKRLDLLLADTEKTREKIDEFIEAQKEKV